MWLGAGDAFHHQLDEGVDETRVRAHRSRACHRQPELPTQLVGFFVEIVQDLDVVR